MDKEKYIYTYNNKNIDDMDLEELRTTIKQMSNDLERLHTTLDNLAEMRMLTQYEDK